MPSAAGLPPERLTVREMAKIVLREPQDQRPLLQRQVLPVSRAGRASPRWSLSPTAPTRPTSPKRKSNRSSFPLATTPRTGICWSWSATSTSCFRANIACAGAGASSADWRVGGGGGSSRQPLAHEGVLGPEEDAASQPDEDPAPPSPVSGSSFRPAADGHGNRCARGIGTSPSPGSLRAGVHYVESSVGDMAETVRMLPRRPRGSSTDNRSGIHVPHTRGSRWTRRSVASSTSPPAVSSELAEPRGSL